MSEVLVVASKVKKMIKEKGGMNTASNVMDAFSQVVQSACEEAMENAKGEGRKTVMNRDFPGHEA